MSSPANDDHREPHTVFILDDHEVTRRGLADLIDAQADLAVVGAAATCAEAIDGIRRTLPTLAVLDARLPDGSGIDVCRQIRQELPEVRCVILTAFDEDDAVIAAVLADASGYLMKAVRGSDFVTSLRAVAAGQRLLHPMAARAARDAMRMSSATDPRFEALSLRERQILSLVAEGRTNRQIAETLGVAEKTVKNHVSSILAKLGFERRTQAAVYAVRGS